MEFVSCYKCGKVHQVIGPTKFSICNGKVYEIDGDRIGTQESFSFAVKKEYGSVFYCDQDQCYYPVNMATAEVSNIDISQERIDF